MKKQYDFSKSKRGAVIKVPRGKSRITIRLDDDVLDWFRQQVDDAGGGSYQNLINQALRAHIERSEEPQERLRRRAAGKTAEKPWMRAFGGLRQFHRANKRVERVIAAEFEQIDEEE